MSIFSPRTYTEIVGDMIARLVATTPLTDINSGSVFTTMLEAAAQEDDEQYFQMLQIVRNYSIDTTSGEELEDRAFEYGLERSAASEASTTVTIGDSAITKVSTTIYSGLAGPVAGETAVNVLSSTGFPSTGTIIVGRGTSNLESKAYSSITDNTNYFTFNLSAALDNDHGVEEDVILSQGGARAITAGQIVSVPSSDISEQIDYTIDENETILDGESEVTGVAVTATIPGTIGNVPIGAIQKFASLPFSTATVTNPSRVTNGRDVETDQELRDRIKDTIQSLSRGTRKAITTGVIGLLSESENRRVISASLIEPTLPADVVRLYIDDGTGIIFNSEHVGVETLVTEATGGEKFLSIENTPIVKANVKSQSVEPFELSGAETLFIEVNGVVETITFVANDFETADAATAKEVVSRINTSSALAESRITADGAVRIFARSSSDDQIRVTGGTANTELNFTTSLQYSTKLYLRRDNVVTLLSKDGITASVESGSAEPYDFSGSQHVLCVVVDGKVLNPSLVFFDTADFSVPATATSAEVAARLEELPGVAVAESSNDTRVKLTSKTTRSSESMIRVVENFSAVYTYNGAFTDITANARTNSGNSTLFAANGNYLYLGHDEVAFQSVWVSMGTLASASITPTFEYYNGSTWSTLGVTDGTNGFQANGIMTFRAPHNWTKTLISTDTVAKYYIRILRGNAGAITAPIESRIRISSANEMLGFSETEAVGADNDYAMNRFIGQIELTSPLLADDQVTLGSIQTRAFVVCESISTYNLSGTETLTVKIDGASAQTVTFDVADFAIPGAATAIEVAERINADLNGATALAVSSQVQITTNSYKEDGSIEVTGGTSNSVLNFPTDVVENLESHVPFLESDATFTFTAGMTVVVVIDESTAGTFIVPCGRTGAITTSVGATSFRDTSLIPVFPAATDLDGMEILITSGALIGTKRSVLTYDPADGTVTVSATFGGTPALAVTYEVIPSTAEEVVRLWNNKKITTLSTKAEVKTSTNGTKVQIASLESGEDASVQVTGGTGNAELGFSTTLTRGIDGYEYYIGLPQIVQSTVDGDEDNEEVYPGLKAAGVQVEVSEPVQREIDISADITPESGVTLSSISSDIKSAISAYVNSLPVGGDVILSEIIVAIKAVSGVFDVEISSPSANVAVADNELVRISDSNITLG